jgi:hypothetical protein
MRRTIVRCDLYTWGRFETPTGHVEASATQIQEGQVSFEDDNEDIREGVRDGEKRREPREVGGPNVEVVALDVEVSGDLICG